MNQKLLAPTLRVCLQSGTSRSLERNRLLLEALRRFIRGLPRAENCFDEHHGLARLTASSEAGTSWTPHLCADRHRPSLTGTPKSHSSKPQTHPHASTGGVVFC